MVLFRDSVIALLAAAGLMLLFYLALRAMFGAQQELCSPVYLVLPVSGKTKDLEQAVGELQRFRRQYGGAAKAVVLDCDMDDEQRRMVRILQREDPLLLVWEEQELMTGIEESR